MHKKHCDGSAQELTKDLAVTYDPGNPPFVVLLEETFVELGNPLKGSVSMVLWTPQEEMVENGAITLVGPDIPASEGESLPFAQVILIGARQIEEEAFPAMERAHLFSHALEGYMTRYMAGKLWSRVSRGAAKKGFDFEVLGRALMARYRGRFPLIHAVEVLFVTSSKQDVMELDGVFQGVKDQSIALRKLSLARDGIYVCNDLTCESCPDKPACDDIRDVVAIRKRQIA
jgi:CO dehydrogenase/acetyl-CoA synthase beta subunit